MTPMRKTGKGMTELFIQNIPVKSDDSNLCLDLGKQRNDDDSQEGEGDEKETLKEKKFNNNDPMNEESLGIGSAFVSSSIRNNLNMPPTHWKTVRVGNTFDESFCSPSFETNPSNVTNPSNNANTGSSTSKTLHDLLQQGCEQSTDLDYGEKLPSSKPMPTMKLSQTSLAAPIWSVVFDRNPFSSPGEISPVKLPMPTMSQVEDEQKLTRHKMHCPNENKDFVLLRQIYPNKDVSMLWDLFVNCNGEINLVIDLLLKEDGRCESKKLNQLFADITDSFSCDCNERELVPKQEQSQYPQQTSKEEQELSNLLDVNIHSTGSMGSTTSNLFDSILKNDNNNSKPLRQRARFMGANLQEPLNNINVQTSSSSSTSSSTAAATTATSAKKMSSSSSGDSYPKFCFVDKLPEMRKFQMPRSRASGESLFAIHREMETQTDSLDNESDDSDQELLEIILGEDLITQLNDTFKSEFACGPKIPDATLAEPIRVFMPRSLGRSIYMLWMESVYNQMEVQRLQIVEEDEQFARLLKHPKYENYMDSPPNTRELLDMEMAWLIYKNDLNFQSELQKQRTQQRQQLQQQLQLQLHEQQHHRQKPQLSGHDLATHLTNMKLCEMFPRIPPDTIAQILAANNNEYRETINVIRTTINATASVSDDSNASALTHEQMMKLVKNETELAQQEDEHAGFDDKPFSFTHFKDDSLSSGSSMMADTKRTTIHEFEEMRNLAAHHSQLRAECHYKAKDAIQRHNHTVALYYSQIANLHKKKIDYYNNRAANYIMNVHSLEQNNPDLLDLHYLHVAEAAVCLDIFLDHHIQRLRNGTQAFKNIFIITGRGLHSVGGVSTIKNRVKNRLKDRGLRWTEVNPGLLKVKLHTTARYSAAK